MDQLSDDMAATAANNRKGFLDLSAELRNEIYNLALTTPETIFIGLDMVRQRHSGGEKRCHWKSVIFDPVSRYFTNASLAPNILVTCKQIKDEATAILYGSNHFHVNPSYIAGDPLWTWSVGTSFKHLRSIHVVYRTDQVGIKVLMEALRGADSLVNLRITDECSWQLRTPRKMAKALQPLIFWLHHICKKRIEENHKTTITKMNWATEALEVGGILTIDGSPRTIDHHKQAIEIVLSKLK